MLSACATEPRLGAGAAAASAVCASAPTLTADAPLTGQQTPAEGTPSANCAPSDAPQAYYALTVPAGQRAFITVTPTSTPAWRAVVRSYASCEAASCLGVETSPTEGTPVTLVLDHRPGNDQPQVVTVSSRSASIHGTFDIAVRFERAPDADLACTSAAPLEPGEPRTGESTPDVGPASVACRTSDAPQRFYLVRVPPLHEARVTVTPTSNPAWSPVVRVLFHCTDDHCQSDEGGQAPGEPVSVSIINDQPSQTFYYAVSVSAAAASVHGRYDIALQLTDRAPSMCGATPIGTLRTDAGDQSVSGELTFTQGQFFSQANPAFYQLEVRERVGVAIVVTSTEFDPRVAIRRGCGNIPIASNDNVSVTRLDAAVRAVLDPGVYTVGVDEALGFDDQRYYRQGGRFTLRLETLAPPANGLCSHALALTPDAPQTGQDLLLGDDSGVACGEEHNPSLFYAVTVPPHQAATVTATASGDPTHAPLAPLAIQAVDACTSRPEICLLGLQPGAVPSETVFNDRDSARTMLFRVSGNFYVYETGSSLGGVDARGIDSHFDVAVRFEPIPPPGMPPANATCAQATTVGDGTLRAREHVGPYQDLALPAPSAYYAATIPPGQVLTATVTPTGLPWTPNIWLLVDCTTRYSFTAAQGAGMPATMTFANTSSSNVPVFLAVSYSGLRPTDAVFNLAVTIRPPPSTEPTGTPPSNAVCANATTVSDGSVVRGQDFAFAPDTVPPGPFNGVEHALYYRATVPAGTALRALPTTSNNYTLRGCVVSACGGNCLTDATSADVVYRNTGTVPQEVLFAVGGTVESYFTHSFDLFVRMLAPSASDSCASPQHVEDGTVLREQGIAPGGMLATTPCTPMQPEALRFYSATIPAHGVLGVDASGLPIRIFDNCEATHCLMGVPRRSGLTTYTNPRDTARDVIIAVAAGTSLYDLAVTIRPPAFIESSIDTDCDPMDDAVALIDPPFGNDSGIQPLPFALPFFGESETHFQAQTGGYLRVFPSAEEPPVAPGSRLTRSISPFIDRLGYTPDGPSFVLGKTFGSAPSRHFTVEWRDWIVRYTSIQMSFQAKLFEGTGVIEFHYCRQDVRDDHDTRRAGGEEATIGVVSAIPTWQHVHHYYDDGPVGPGAAIRLVPNDPPAP